MIVRRFLILLGLLAGAAALVSSCREASPVGVDARTRTALAGRGTPAGDDGDDGDDPAEPPDDETEASDSLVSCRPLPYDSVTRRSAQRGASLK